MHRLLWIELHIHRTHIRYMLLEIISMLALCSVAHSCPTLCDPMDYSPPGSSVHGNFQYIYNELIIISSFYSIRSSRFKNDIELLEFHLWFRWSRIWLQCWCMPCMLSCFSPVRLCATLWTVACQASLAMWFSRQEY